MHNKLQKAILQSILKLPRDRKGKHELKNEARGADFNQTLTQTGGPLILPCEQPTEPGPYPGTGIGVWSSLSTRSEAKGLGGFRLRGEAPRAPLPPVGPTFDF